MTTSTIHPTTVSLHSQTVGPRHDPYGRDTLTVTRHGHTYEFISCGLAGYAYKRDGEMVHDFVQSNESSTKDWAINAFTQDTGASPDQWYDWYYRLHTNDEEDGYGSLSQYE